MNRKLLLIPFLLTGCGDEASFSYPDLTPNEVIYTYPYDGQQAVARRAPVVVRLADPLATIPVSGEDPADVSAALADLELAVQDDVAFTTASDDPVSFDVSVVVDDPSASEYVITTVVLQPASPLEAGTDYVVDVSGLETAKGNATYAGGNLDFTTAAQAGGPRSVADLGGGFSVVARIPDGDSLPFLDFSTLRLQFSQPVDPATVVYGDTLSLSGPGDALVPATVLVSGHRLTIDPINDLLPDVEYTLTATGGVQSVYGEALSMDPVTMTAGDSAPREILVQASPVSEPDPGSQCDTSLDTVIRSPLTGDAINCVPVQAVLLGNDTVSQSEGDVHAELAYVPRYPEVSPLRVPRGTLLRGSSLDVLVAGQVPVLVDTNDDGDPDTPLSTGDISVTFVSDASGFLLPNPYSQQPDAPRHVRLYLDVAMTAATTEANGSLSQDLLHVEVVGTAIVEDGRLIIDAIGTVEPEVLGLEQAYGLLSFHLESYADQNTAPAPVVDAGMPFVQSWVPGDAVDRQRPGQPVIINFSEPVARESLTLDGALAVTRNGSAVDFEWRLDGSALVIEPDGGLLFSREGENSQYQVSLSTQVTDLAGNGLDQAYDLSFTMPLYLGDGDRAPIATVTYPGYPCAVDSGTWDLANDDHGRCQFGESSDDNLPVMPMPADRSIRVQFSQVMREDSFVLGGACGAGTFRVERANNDGSCIAPVPGRLEVGARSVTFTPDEPWQEGVLYRYVMLSKDDIVPADCGVATLCSSFDYPLQTAVLDGRDADRGGPDMRLYFRGAAPVSHVFQTLDNLPTLDVNSNYFHEDEEPDPVADPENAGQFLTPPNGTRLEFLSSSGLLLDANLGCGFVDREPDTLFLGPNPARQVCNDKKFIHLTGALNADVLGWNEEEGAIEVNVYPNILMTTSLDTYAVLSLIIAKEVKLIPTGPQIMRVRYEDDGFGNRTRPVTGWIRETVDGPVMDINLDVYLDAPDLEPEALGLTLTHDLYSYPLSLSLSGPVTLLPDGRMRIRQANLVSPDSIDVSISLIGIGAAGMSLGIPADGVRLDYISQPVKK